MANLANVRRALYDHAEALELTPAHEIVFTEPGETFDPPSDGPYLEVQINFNQQRWQGLTGGGLDQGLLTVTPVWPKNQSDDGVIRAAQAVREHFTGEPLTLFYGGTVTKITKEPDAAGPFRDPTTIRVPVTISWVA